MRSLVEVLPEDPVTPTTVSPRGASRSTTVRASSAERGEHGGAGPVGVPGERDGADVGVGHAAARRPRARRPAGGEHPDGAPRDRVRGEVVPVDALAGQGDEQAAGLDLAGVELDGAR